MQQRGEFEHIAICEPREEYKEQAEDQRGPEGRAAQGIPGWTEPFAIDARRRGRASKTNW